MKKVNVVLFSLYSFYMCHSGVPFSKATNSDVNIRYNVNSSLIACAITSPNIYTYFNFKCILLHQKENNNSVSCYQYLKENI